MVFSSVEFLLGFLIITILLYYNPFFKSRTFKNSILLFVSLGFYAWGEPVFVFLMIGSILITWILGLLIDKYKKYSRTILTIGIALHAALLFIFKYFTFFFNQICTLLHAEIAAVTIALPIGISFFTFQLMSYLFDVYYEKAPVQKNLLWLALYVSFFPQLIAGPIVRYDQICSQIHQREETSLDFALGIQRFIFGLAKKLLLSNYLAQIADNIFVLTEMSVMTAWLGAFSYALQIYFDFSGYSDMAIGLSQMFGFHLTENFNYPYIANSITEFWRRWHISLGTWFRDYVYIPLGGSKCSHAMHTRNMFIVWLLTGIWHGANWTFIVWGLYYFCILYIEKNTSIIKHLGKFSYITTLILVTLGWVIFRSETLISSIHYIGIMFGIGAANFMDTVFLFYLNGGRVVLLASIILCIPIYPYLKNKYSTIFCYLDPVNLIILGFLTFISIIATTYIPFIYFNF